MKLVTLILIFVLLPFAAKAQPYGVHTPRDIHRFVKTANSFEWPDEWVFERGSIRNGVHILCMPELGYFEITNVVLPHPLAKRFSEDPDLVDAMWKEHRLLVAENPDKYVTTECKWHDLRVTMQAEIFGSGSGSCSGYGTGIIRLWLDNIPVFDSAMISDCKGLWFEGRIIIASNTLKLGGKVMYVTWGQMFDFRQRYYAKEFDIELLKSGKIKELPINNDTFSSFLKLRR